MYKHLHTFFNSVLDGKGYSYASRHVLFEVAKDNPRFKRLFQKAGGKGALTPHFRRNRMVLWDNRIFTSLYINNKHCMIALCADTSNTELALHLRDHCVGDTVVLTRMHADRNSDVAHLEKHDISYNGRLVTLTDIDQDYLTVRTGEGDILRVTESQVAHKLAADVVEDLLGHITLLVEPVDEHWVTCQACGADLGSKSWVACAGCGERTYCNRECAVQGWPQHKLWCTTVKRNVCSFCLERFPIDARRRPKCSCRQVYYCGRECQKKDWKTHKLSCKFIL